MFPTKNHLDENIRSEMIELLAARLADSIDLMLQCKQAHWNVKGPDFIALHKLFDKVAEHVVDYTDGIAERLVQLGGATEGTIRVASQKSTLAEYPLEIRDGLDHVEALSSVLAQYGSLIHRAILQSGQAGDPTTSDLFTEISRQLDEDLWFVESHLKSEEQFQLRAAEQHRGAHAPAGAH